MSATPSPPALPHHEVLRALGGASFLLRHGRTGALQVARAVATLAPAAARQRAERLAAVRHPGLGPPALVVEERGALWAVRPFVEGEALADVLARGEAVPAPLEAVGAICSAVAALHAAGLAHGRLHSGNVVRGIAGWVVVDALEPFRPPGGEGCRALACAAPEVLRGRAGGARADVFSLGLLLQALLAGREPVAERDPLEVVRTILYGAFPPLAVVAPGVAPAIAEVAARALERRPWRRPRSAGVMARVVAEVVASEAAEVQRATAEERAAAESIAAEAARAATIAAAEAEVPVEISATAPARDVREEATAQVLPEVEVLRPVARPIRAASRPIVIANPTSNRTPTPTLPPAPTPVPFTLSVAPPQAAPSRRAARTSAAAARLRYRALSAARHPRTLALAAALALVALAAGVGLLARDREPGFVRAVEQRLVAGDVEGARRALRDAERGRPGDPLVEKLRGDVACARRAYGECLRRYDAALTAAPRLAADARIRENALALAARGDDRRAVVGVLAKLAGLDPALAALTRGERYWPRWNAVRALEARGRANQVDYARVYALDLVHAGSCDTRRAAANKLARLRDRRVLPELEHALAAARGSFWEWRCTGPEVEDALRATRAAALAAR